MAVLIVPLSVLFFSLLIAQPSSSSAAENITPDSSNAEIEAELCRIDPNDENRPNNENDAAQCRRIIGENLQQCLNQPSDPDTEMTQQRRCKERIIENPRQFIDDRLRTEVARNFDGDCSEKNRSNRDEGPLHPDNCGIMAYIRIFTDGLTVLVGVVVTAMLVFGGIQYSSAGSNPQKVQAAKQHISQALLALVLWIFMATFLQWLIPGGVF